MKTRDMMVEYVGRLLDHFGVKEVTKENFEDASIYAFNVLDTSTIVHTTDEAMENFAKLDDMSVIKAEEIVDKYITVPECRVKLFNLMADYYIYENNIIDEVLRKRIVK